jgi:Beta-ketoacyl synthase, N-terminal domain
VQDWRTWLNGGLSPSPEDQPDVSFLPGLLRRRLDRLGRMALYTAWPCAEGLDSIQYIFASRYGDMNRTVELLTALANEDTLSPTLFTLSVHNNVAGLFAIARGDRSAATAMAAGADTLVLSILEGANMIAEGAKHVVVTYADDLVPDIYREFVTEDTMHPFAISLLLTPVNEVPLRCRMGRYTGSITQQQSSETALIRFLSEDATGVVLGTNQTWQLERDHAG